MAGTFAGKTYVTGADSKISVAVTGTGLLDGTFRLIIHNISRGATETITLTQAENTGTNTDTAQAFEGVFTNAAKTNLLEGSTTMPITFCSVFVSSSGAEFNAPTDQGGSGTAQITSC